MILVLLESPYAGYVERNLAYARACMRDCNFTPAGVLDDDLPDERELGIRAGFAWGRKAERTVVYLDHGMSRGMEAGIQVAKMEGRPIEHRRLYPAPAHGAP